MRVAAVAVSVSVSVTEVGGGSENGNSDRSQDGGRGCGARARRLPGAVVRPLPPLRLGGGKGTTSPGGRGEEVVARSFVCSWKRQGRRACSFFGTLSFLAVTGFGDPTTTTRAQCGSGAFFVCGLRPCSI